MIFSEQRVNRFQRGLGKLELPAMGTKNELQRQFRKQLQFVMMENKNKIVREFNISQNLFSI